MKVFPNQLRQVVFLLSALLSLVPGVSSAIALVTGFGVALWVGNPDPDLTKKWVQKILPLSIVGLGFGMDLFVVARAGAHGAGVTVAGIALTFALGMIVARALKLDRIIAQLITTGTAICGGSAIAAVGPILQAKPHEMSVALGTVFMLNAAALVLFPWIGHAVGLNEGQFGLWSAIAIHDTSSVVGATLQYGHHALEVGTTVKLARALWIVPLTFVMARGKAAKFPKFILGFVGAACLVTFVPALQEIGHWVEVCTKRTLVLAIYLIGSQLSPAIWRKVGIMPIFYGFFLWLVVASTSLFVILRQWI